MTGEFGGPGLKDALVILGAAGIVIPAFARLKISPVIGFIIVGMIVGPFGLGSLATRHQWIATVSIGDARGIAPFAEFGIILLLFAIGLELSFRRLGAMRWAIFGIGAAELLLGTVPIGAGLWLAGEGPASAAVLAIALAMSSTALVLPIAGMNSPVGRAAFAMLLFEDLALVPLLFVLGSSGPVGQLPLIFATGAIVIAAMLLAGRFLLPPL